MLGFLQFCNYFEEIKSFLPNEVSHDTIQNVNKNLFKNENIYLRCGWYVDDIFCK